MNIEGSQVIHAPRDVVWRALNDEAVLKDCIPGCKSLIRESDTNMRGTVAIRIGVVSATFDGVVKLSDVAAPSGYTISGEGKGGIAGFAKGQCKVDLVEVSEHATELRFSARSEIGGKLASIGARLIDGVARKIVADFFNRFGTSVREIAVLHTDNIPPRRQEVPTLSVVS